MNPFMEWERIKASRVAADHKSGTLSDATFTSIQPGWWKLSADQDFRWLGPETTSASITSDVSTAGAHEWAKDNAVFRANATSYVAMATAVTSGTWWLDKMCGV